MKTRRCLSYAVWRRKEEVEKNPFNKGTEPVMFAQFLNFLLHIPPRTRYWGGHWECGFRFCPVASAIGEVYRDCGEIAVKIWSCDVAIERLWVDRLLESRCESLIVSSDCFNGRV